MALSEKPDSQKESAEKKSTESDEMMDLDSILNEGGSSSGDSPTPKPYIPDIEETPAEDNPAKTDEKWQRVEKKFPENLLDQDISSVQARPEPQEPQATAQPEPQAQLGKQYIPGMEVVSTGIPEKQKSAKKTNTNNPVVTILFVLLILGGGGYLGYWAYQKYWKPAERAKEQAAASETADGAGKILMTQVQPGSNNAMKTKTDAEDVNLKPAAPKPTEEQVKQAQANIMGFFDKAKNLVATQNRRLKETISNTEILKDTPGAETSEAKDATQASDTEGKVGDTEPQAEAPIYISTPEGFTLTGTMNMNGDRLAFVNDTVVRVGEEINGAKVVQIGHRWVELKKDNQLFRLNMD